MLMQDKQMKQKSCLPEPLPQVLQAVYRQVETSEKSQREQLCSDSGSKVSTQTALLTPYLCHIELLLRGLGSSYSFTV